MIANSRLLLCRIGDINEAQDFEAFDLALNRSLWGATQAWMGASMVGWGRTGGFARTGHTWGTWRPSRTGGKPNSVYTWVKGGKAHQNWIYDSQGRVIGHVDFNTHVGQPSGHGHAFPIPGQPSSGHGSNAPHIPYGQLPAAWKQLPPGMEPQTPIGQ